MQLTQKTEKEETVKLSTRTAESGQTASQDRELPEVNGQTLNTFTAIFCFIPRFSGANTWAE